jgi:hypothetical protein
MEFQIAVPVDCSFLRQCNKNGKLCSELRSGYTHFQNTFFATFHTSVTALVYIKSRQITVKVILSDKNLY